MQGRGKAAAIAGTVGLALVLAACGSGHAASGTSGSSTTAASSGSSGSSSSTTTASSSSAPPQTNATLTIGSSVFPPTLDLTSNAAAAIDEVMDYNVYQHLVQLDPKGEIVPVLATSDTVSKNGLTYTFDIRSGVKFSNGNAMTPADVVFSLQRAANPKNAYPYGTLLSDIGSVKAAGNTVVVTMKHPDNQFLYNLAAYSNGVVLDPTAVKTIATKPVGTGPYVYSSEVDNYSVTLNRNPNYWGTKAGVNEVEFRYFTSGNTENEALKTGQIQVIDNLDVPQDASQFKGSGYQLLSGPTNGKIQMTINNASGPLAKVQVRQAIQYATDKAAILQAAGGGYGTVIASDDVPGDPWYMPAINKTYAYNVNKAKSLLAAAGYAHGLSLTLDIPPYSYAQTAAPLIQANLKAVGINVTLKNIQWPAWLTQVFKNSDFQLTIIDHVEARDIANYATCPYYWKYANCTQVESMLNKASEATTTGGEVSGYEAVVKKINAEAVNDWLYNNDQLTAAKSDVIGLPGSGLTESFDLSHVAIGGTLPASAAAQGYAS
jgi:peptide/nickel transport system substrate-binding protein